MIGTPLWQPRILYCHKKSKKLTRIHQMRLFLVAYLASSSPRCTNVYSNTDKKYGNSQVWQAAVTWSLALSYSQVVSSAADQYDIQPASVWPGELHVDRLSLTRLWTPSQARSRPDRDVMTDHHDLLMLHLIQPFITTTISSSSSLVHHSAPRRQQLLCFRMLQCCTNIIVIVIQRPTSTQLVCNIVINANRPQRRSLGSESAVEDRISPLQSHWQPLENTSCFPRVLLK